MAKPNTFSAHGAAMAQCAAAYEAATVKRRSAKKIGQGRSFRKFFGKFASPAIFGFRKFPRKFASLVSIFQLKDALKAPKG